MDDVPIPSRAKHQVLLAYKNSTEMLRKRGFTPKLQRLGNKSSKILQNFMEEQGVTFQLTLVCLHRRNNAERAIQTFNNNFTAGLSSTPTHFPLNLWGKLLPQALLILNLMITSRVNQQLYAYAHIHGTFDYHKSIISPPETSYLAHVHHPYSLHRNRTIQIGVFS